MLVVLYLNYTKGGDKWPCMGGRCPATIGGAKGLLGSGWPIISGGPIPGRTTSDGIMPCMGGIPMPGLTMGGMGGFCIGEGWGAAMTPPPDDTDK